MILLTYIQTHDSIFKAVKQESSYLAKRLTDGQGDSKFEDMVFDEAYLTLFRGLFFDARSNVSSACAAYLKDVVDITYFDQGNFDHEKDFILQLNMSDNFIVAMNNNVDIKMKEYLVAYIMYRWLETKSQESGLYLQRAETHLQDMKRFLEMRKSRKIKNNSPW